MFENILPVSSTVFYCRLFLPSKIIASKFRVEKLLYQINQFKENSKYVDLRSQITIFRSNKVKRTKCSAFSSVFFYGIARPCAIHLMSVTELCVMTDTFTVFGRLRFHQRFRAFDDSIDCAVAIVK